MWPRRHNLSPGRRDPLMLKQSAFSHDLSSDQAEQLQKLARRLLTNAYDSFYKQQPWLSSVVKAAMALSGT